MIFPLEIMDYRTERSQPKDVTPKKRKRRLIELT